MYSQLSIWKISAQQRAPGCANHVTFTSPVGHVFGVARYFDLAADERSDVTELQRLASDEDVALALSAPRCFRSVTIATKPLELLVNDLYRANDIASLIYLLT